MSFDEIQLPLRVGYGAKGGPAFSTEVVTIDGGYERRNQVWSQARRKFDARTGVKGSADAALLLSFFQARAGRARGFRLRDWCDFSSATDGQNAPTPLDQTIGTGDDATTQFQLIKNYGSGGVTYARAIKKPVADSVSVAINGVTQSTGWSIDTTTGIILFAAAPPANATITVGFLFDVPVRFDTDHLNLTTHDPRVFEGEIPLIEIRL